MKKVNLAILQFLLWVLIYLLLLIYNIRTNQVLLGFISATINLITYASTIYINSLLLLPRFVSQKKYLRYGLLSILAICLLVLNKTTLEYFIHYRYFGIYHFYNFKAPHLAMAFLSVMLCFIIGGLLYLSLDYVKLYQKQEVLQNQQLTAELNLLKLQVQPHFMFNTLNNIYSLAYIKSNKTAQIVAKLSDIMRYFVEQAPKERVALSTEITFLKNYIALEAIRMLYPLSVNFEINLPEKEIMLPPMLFTHFIENVFKHGIDKRSKKNYVNIYLFYHNNTLCFQIQNPIFQNARPIKVGGTGLNNIRKRLDILYPKQYELRIQQTESFFRAELKIPLELNYALLNH